jgi:hypothetical protein
MKAISTTACTVPRFLQKLKPAGAWLGRSDFGHEFLELQAILFISCSIIVTAEISKIQNSLVEQIAVFAHAFLRQFLERMQVKQYVSDWLKPGSK